MPSHVSLEEGDVTRPVGRLHGHGGRDGMMEPQATERGSHQNLGGKEWIVSLEPLEGVWLCGNP